MSSTIAVIYNLEARAVIGYETFAHNINVQKSFFIFAIRRKYYERLLFVAEK